jgi:hypothetical protein
MEEKPCIYRFDWKFGSYRPKPICPTDVVCKPPPPQVQVCPPQFNVTLWVEHACPKFNSALLPRNETLSPRYYADILGYFVRDLPAHYRDYCKCNDNLAVQVLDVKVERPFLITLSINALLNGAPALELRTLLFLKALCGCELASIVPRWGYLVRASYSLPRLKGLSTNCAVDDRLVCRADPTIGPLQNTTGLLPLFE